MALVLSDQRVEDLFLEWVVKSTAVIAAAVEGEFSTTPEHLQ
jgi:hypothetical protein